MTASRILVVDDEADIRGLLKEILAEEGYEVEVAADATQARTSRATHVPDLVLLDVELPDGSGIDLARRLRCADRPPQVLMLSAFADAGQVVAAMQAGARGYLAKTASREHLLDSIRAVARGATVFDSSAGAALWSAPQEIGRAHV